MVGWELWQVRRTRGTCNAPGQGCLAFFDQRLCQDLLRVCDVSDLDSGDLASQSDIVAPGKRLRRSRYRLQSSHQRRALLGARLL
jgi:hypothetical protein